MIIESFIAYIIGKFYFQLSESKENHLLEVEILDYVSSVLTVMIISLYFQKNHSIHSIFFVFLGMITLEWIIGNRWNKYMRRILEDLREKKLLLIPIYHNEVTGILLSITNLIKDCLIILLLNALSLWIPEIGQWIISAFLILIVIYILKVSIKSSGQLKSISLQMVWLIITVSLVLFVLLYWDTTIQIVNIGTFLVRRGWNSTFYHTLISYLLTVLLLGKPMNEFIRILISRFDPKEDSIETPDEKVGYSGAGAMIGSLERLLMLISLINGSLVTVVAILSIKAFARYSKIVDSATFAEYFVIGTMLSVFLTLGVYLLLNQLL